MVIESFLAKIAAAVFKKAALGTLLSKAATAYEMYSTFDQLHDLAHCIQSTND